MTKNINLTKKQYQAVQSIIFELATETNNLIRMKLSRYFIGDGFAAQALGFEIGDLRATIRFERMMGRTMIALDINFETTEDTERYAVDEFDMMLEHFNEQVSTLLGIA